MKTDSASLIEKSYRECLSDLRTYIRYKTNDEETAKDIAQEVYLRLLKSDYLLCAKTVRNMVFTIARNLVIDYQRQHLWRQRTTDRIVGEIENGNACAVETDVERRDLVREAHRCLRRLPERRRAIYIMSRVEEKSIQEIAEMFKLSRRTVENHIFRSDKEMRTYIKQCI